MCALVCHGNQQDLSAYNKKRRPNNMTRIFKNFVERPISVYH